MARAFGKLSGCDVLINFRKLNVAELRHHFGLVYRVRLLREAGAQVSDLALRKNRAVDKRGGTSSAEMRIILDNATSSCSAVRGSRRARAL